MMTFLFTFACKCSSLAKSHHVMMTFLVFDLDVLFIPCNREGGTGRGRQGGGDGDGERETGRGMTGRGEMGTGQGGGGDGGWLDGQEGGIGGWRGGMGKGAMTRGRLKEGVMGTLHKNIHTHHLGIYWVCRWKRIKPS